MFDFFTRKIPNPTNLIDFLNSTELDGWNYKNALSINDTEIEKATHEQLLNNPSDVADGVVRVEMVFSNIFFGIFDNLVIKYRDDQSVQLMFYTTTDDPELVQSFFKQLKPCLGGGYIADHKFASFNEHDQIAKLAQGQAFSESDELFHSWLRDDFSFTLNYRIDPRQQLLFIAKSKPEKVVDYSLRTNGTLLSILTHDLNTVLKQEALNTEIKSENGQVKYVDYAFELSPPELGIFDVAKIRIFDSVKSINENTQIHVTYFSKYEADTAKVITLCDSIIDIYGPDNFGDAELQPHEWDMIDNSEFWTGRTWWLNKAHGIYDVRNKTQTMLYEVRLGIEHDEGFSLHIVAFQNMLFYHGLINSSLD